MRLRVMVVLMVPLGACSGADESVRTLNSKGSGSGSRSASGTASGTSSDSACAPPSEPASLSFSPSGRCARRTAFQLAM